MEIQRLVQGNRLQNKINELDKIQQVLNKKLFQIQIENIQGSQNLEINILCGDNKYNLGDFENLFKKLIKDLKEQTEELIKHYECDFKNL